MKLLDKASHAGLSDSSSAENVDRVVRNVVRATGETGPEGGDLDGIVDVYAGDANELSY